MTQKSSPLHKWGWKLTMKKNKNVAVAAVELALNLGQVSAIV
jgi:hypothetical protein